MVQPPTLLSEISDNNVWYRDMIMKKEKKERKEKKEKKKKKKQI